MKRSKFFAVGMGMPQAICGSKYQAIKMARKFGAGCDVVECITEYNNEKRVRFVQGREWVYELGKLRKL